MKLKTILLLTLLLFIPRLLSADEMANDNLTHNNTILEEDTLDIKGLIEKAKKASSEDRIVIEKLIKKKIAEAHRDNHP